MAQPLSIEDKKHVYFITTRTAGSRLLLVGNPHLEKQILGCLARYQEIYKVILYGFIIMGNHYHLIASFPEANRASFMRDFNSAIARLIGRAVGIHGRRSVWARRYSWQVLPRNEDILHWYYYLVLNPVSSGLLEDPSKYPSYSSFLKDPEKFIWIDYSKYILKSRTHRNISLKDFEITYTLSFSKIPGIEDEEELSYKRNLKSEFEKRRAELIIQRREKGFGFMGLPKLLKQQVGAHPRKTKQSTRRSFRPIVLSLCSVTKKYMLGWYFAIRDKFTSASLAFRSGELSVKFPCGTYRPPCFMAA